MLRFRRALADLVRRWGTYVAVALLLFSAGSNAPLTIASATASALLWPLRDGAMHGWWIVPVTLGYAFVGWLPVVTTRPLWWPSGWGASERALPLDPASIRRSDRRFAVILMSPWQALLLFGGVGAWWHEPGGRSWTAVLAAGAIAAALSLQASLWWMRVARSDRATARPSRAGRRGRRRTTSIAPVGAVRALVAWPLARGRAVRSATALVVGTLATATCAVTLLACSVSLPWAAAALVLASLGATGASRAATRRELLPLWRDRPSLPLDRRRCERARHLLVLGPTAIGLAAFFAVAVTRVACRPTVLAAYCAVVAVGCAIEATTRETMNATDRAARWILFASLGIAFGSELVPS